MWLADALHTAADAPIMTIAVAHRAGASQSDTGAIRFPVVSADKRAAAADACCRPTDALGSRVLPGRTVDTSIGLTGTRREERSW
jgi:hypothetical protein